MLCRIAQWDCFEDAIASCAGDWVQICPQNSPTVQQSDLTPTQSNTYLSPKMTYGFLNLINTVGHALL